MKYVIECEGHIYGPFDDDRAAFEWAHNQCATLAWQCRPIRHPSEGRLQA